ncbi:TonB-dependent receptor [Sphingorhabdus pulchriflava]|uniref:TonB-dependent receptor n=1 Tax=Sphingorhabdus pulchriflava TaxID=2292257 RepID=A0A371BFY3_9SPHN|nr:TonB-dependent receptor [Sphingorhabdus pulchriflava]RDV06490.1 TonB-dependent receptor [Sphingorhabdus pulchriflava]
MKHILPLLSLPLVALTQPAYAQTCDAECEELDRIERDLVHYGRRIERPADFPVSIISADDLIVVTGGLPNPKSDITEDSATVRLPQLPGERLENALLAVNGLQQFRRSDARSANPTSQGVTLRGLGGNASSRALLFLDDVPQADPFGGWVSWPGYDALNLASIRVRKGGGQPSAGPGALAGVIELDSVQNREAASLALAYGSRNSIDGKANYSGKLGGGSVTAAASYARGDGFIPILASQRGSVDRRAPYEQAGLSLRGVAPLNASIELQANLRAFTDTRDRGVDFSDNSNSGVDASLRLVDRPGDWQWSATGYVQVREFSSEFGAIAANRNSVTQTLDQFATPSTGLGARFEVRPPVGEQIELRLGGEWRRTSGEVREFFTYVAGAPTRFRTAGGQTDSYGGFAEWSYQPSDTLTLSAGGRLDRWTITDGFRREVNIGGTVRSDDRFADRSGTEWTGRAGFGWDFADGFTLRGAAYRAWRLPTLNELYRPFRVGADATAANENLQPETVEGFDAGLAYTNGSVDFGITLFRNRLNDAIANVTLGQGPGNFPGVGFVAAGGTYRQRQNLDAIVSRGIEADARFDLTEQFALKLGYAFVDAEVRGSGPSAALDGFRPAQVPRHFGNATLAYAADKVSASSTLRYVGAQFEDDANVRALDDVLTLDLDLGFELGDGLRLQMRGENLFDARVEAAVSGSGIIERANPRTLWLGASWKFD